jgi:hypothetical protein
MLGGRAQPEFSTKCFVYSEILGCAGVFSRVVWKLVWKRTFEIMELEDWKLGFSYDQLRVETIRCLGEYITSRNSNLAELQARCRHTLPAEVRQQVKTVEELVQALEERGVIGNNNVEFIKLLAEELGLVELVKKAVEFETKYNTGNEYNKPFHGFRRPNTSNVIVTLVTFKNRFVFISSVIKVL